MRKKISAQPNPGQLALECTKNALIDTLPGFAQITALSIKSVAHFLNSGSKLACCCKYGLNNIGFGLGVAIDAYYAGKEAMENVNTNQMTKWEASVDFFKDIAVSVGTNLFAATVGSFTITLTTHVITALISATVLTGGLTLVPILVGGVVTAAVSFLGAFIWGKFKMKRKNKKVYAKLCEQFGVNENDNDKDIKKAYHKLARQLHFDRNFDQMDRQLKEEQFKEITINFAKLNQLRVILGKCNKKVNLDQMWFNRLIEYATRLWVAVNLFYDDERVEKAMIQFEENTEWNV